MNRRPNCYVSSRVTPERIKMWRDAQKGGARICSTWIHRERNPNDSNATFGTNWAVNQMEIGSCDRLVLFIGEDDFPFEGALIEAGMALALGKMVYIVANAASVRKLGKWIYHPSVIITDNLLTAFHD